MNYYGKYKKYKTKYIALKNKHIKYYNSIHEANTADENYKIHKWYAPEKIIKEEIEYIYKHCSDKLCTKENIENILREYYLSIPQFIHIKINIFKPETYKKHAKHIASKTKNSMNFVIQILQIMLDKSFLKISDKEEISFIVARCKKCKKNDVRKVLKIYYDYFINSKDIDPDVKYISKKTGVTKNLVKLILEAQFHFLEKKGLIINI